MKNIDINKKELAALRALPDFDLMLVLSEIDEHRWVQHGRMLLHQACHSCGISREGLGLPLGMTESQLNRFFKTIKKMPQKKSPPKRA